MARPHPSDAEFAVVYSQAWTAQPAQLLDFFTPDGRYTDVAMGATANGTLLSHRDYWDLSTLLRQAGAL